MLYRSLRAPPAKTHYRTAASLRWPRAVALICAAFLLWACGDAGLLDVGPHVDLAMSDTTLFIGEAVTIAASVIRQERTITAEGVVWSVSDTSVLRLDLEALQPRLIARARGSAFVIGAITLIGREYRDSAEVTVVQPGDVRWRAPLNGGATGWLWTVALDPAGNIYLTWGESSHGALSAFGPGGAMLFERPTDCWATGIGPSVDEGGRIYVTGQSSTGGCTVAFGSSAGTLDWAAAVGNWDAGVAVSEGGSVYVAHDEGSDTEWSVVLSRFEASGEEAWQTTLGQGPGLNWTKSPPAIGANGDIYMAWTYGTFGQAAGHRLSAIGSDGSSRWAAGLSGRPRRTTPAVTNDRVIVGHDDGVTAWDHSGSQLWSWPAAGQVASSPVVDGGGNVYVLFSDHPRSFTPDGQLGWEADIDAGVEGPAAPAPTLLAGGEMLVMCRLEFPFVDVCALDSADGSLIWRSDFGGGSRVGSPAVGSDGTIYVLTVIDGEPGLLALWGRVPPLSEGWPTEGGGMGHLRR